MARNQTIFSELLVAATMVGYDTTTVVSWDPSWKKVKGVDDRMRVAFQKECTRRSLTSQGQRSIRLLIQAGEKAREKLVAEFGKVPFVVKYVGGEKDGRHDAVTRDLEIPQFNIRLSVKEGSDVIWNSDPPRLCAKLSGREEPAGTRHDNWFQEVAEAQHEELVRVCGGGSVARLYALPKSQRKAFGHRQQDGRKYNTPAKEEAYRQMTGTTSRETEKCFKAAIRQAKEDGAFNDAMLHWLFRMNGIRYMMVGTDDGVPFALWIPATREWEKQWKLEDIVVQANAQSLQSEVFLDIRIRNKRTKELKNFRLVTEIRWSHGPFCGNPEAKLKKDWIYSDLPWVK
jgi:hypothetical protein